MALSLVGTITRLARVFLSLVCVFYLRRALVCGALQGHVELSRSTEDGSEVWGYSQVRKGAHMFWWLYYSTHPSGNDTRPLLIWLQGGPGLSATGVGNLALMGPFDEKMQPRNSTWIREANVLFVDNPVGVGYSYIDNGTSWARNSEEIALDLVNLLYSFTNHLPQFKNTSIYIFGQSYGGKMAAVFACQLYKAIERKEIDVKLKGVAFGNAWISPKDSVLNWAPLMLHMSVIDQFQFDKVDKSARDMAQEIDSCGAHCSSSHHKWKSIEADTKVNFYNLLKYQDEVYYENSLIYALMKGDIRQKLLIIPDNVTWKNQARDVYRAVTRDFLKAEIDKVDWLLERNIEIIVYSGQLDIMCPTNGAQDWLNKLKWKEYPHFYQSKREALFPPGGKMPEMFVKAHKNLKFYYILNSGHAVPRDTPAASLRMLSYIINNQHKGGALYSHCCSSHLLIVVHILTLIAFYVIV